MVRDPFKLAALRDRRCQHTEEEIAIALDGRYRPEYVLELKLCYQIWKTYQTVIGEIDHTIDSHLKTLQIHDLPPLPPKPRVRGKKPHDPKFDVRKALNYLAGLGLTM